MDPIPATVVFEPGSIQHRLRQRLFGSVDLNRKSHIPSALSGMEILYVLYSKWVGDDGIGPQVVLSKGHGALALYTVFAELGRIEQAELEEALRPGSRLTAHPECDPELGIPIGTGALGHGPAIALGIELGRRIKGRAETVFAVVGDGEMAEGSVWETLFMARHLNAYGFLLIVDANGFQAAGSISRMSGLNGLAETVQAMGLWVEEVDGHSIDDLTDAISRFGCQERPGVLIAHTVKGAGVPFMAGSARWHYVTGYTDAETAALADLGYGGLVDARRDIRMAAA